MKSPILFLIRLRMSFYRFVGHKKNIEFIFSNTKKVIFAKKIIVWKIHRFFALGRLSSSDSSVQHSILFLFFFDVKIRNWEKFSNNALFKSQWNICLIFQNYTAFTSINESLSSVSWRRGNPCTTNSYHICGL